MTTTKKETTEKNNLNKMLSESQELLENDTRALHQEFVAFFPKQLEALHKAEELYRQRLGVGGRARTIGLACNLLIKVLEETTEEKNDETV